MSASAAKGRILIVDDDENAVEILTRMLAREGYTSLAAQSGPEALRLLEQESVNVILLDVMMPGMDGFAVCERLRENDQWREIPVILLTARDDLESRARGMKLGVSEYLTKPVNRAELFARIDTQLHAAALTRKMSETAEAISGKTKLPNA